MGGLGEQLRDPRRWARDFALATGLALFLAPVGPFGSYHEPFGRRLVECLGFSWAAALIWSPGLALILWVAAKYRIHAGLARVAAAVVLSAPIALAVGLVGRLFWPGGTRPPLLTIYPQIVGVAVPLAVISYVVRTWMARPAATAPAPPTPAPPRLMARLPAAIEGQVLALQAEDHYVRVHTVRGSTLILMRLADAILELDGQAGLQVHRSWWVARGAVTGAAKAGRRASLTLANGLAVPVSRAAMPQARASGLLSVRS
jgi:hypothetical protein